MKRLCFLALAVAGMAGCNSTTVVDIYRATPTAMPTNNESVVVLGRHESMDHDTENDFISCVGKTLHGSKNKLNVIPEKQFVDSMYPYFETSTAPTDVKGLDKLIQVPEVAARLDRYNIRYMIWIDGATETVDKSGSITCAVGPGGGGCFGFASWEDQGNYEASIWDFKQLALSGKISAQTDGRSYLPAVVIPIPILARVQANACKSMATQILSFLH